jgi:preprotein translocase subunit SecE
MKVSPEGAFFRISTMSMMSYLKEVKAELKNVTWPTFEQTVLYTASVLLVSALVGLFLTGVDVSLKKVLEAALALIKN